MNLNLELGLSFDFFGLGQPINRPDMQNNQLQGQNQEAWDPWPEEAQVQDQQMQEAQDPEPIVNLNEPPVPQDNEAIVNMNEPLVPEQNEAIDLNQPPMNLDLDPVIINPAHPPNDGDFLEVNDLQGNEEVHYLL